MTKLSKAFSIAVLILASSFAACTRTTPPPAAQAPVTVKSPEEVVKSFVELSAAVRNSADRETLRKFCSGEMRRAFERMTDEVFRITYLSSNLKVKELKILSSTTENDTAKVRYQVTILNNMGTDVTNETNEREVELTRAEGQWYIDSIRAEGSDKIAFTNGMLF